MTILELQNRAKKILTAKVFIKCQSLKTRTTRASKKSVRLLKISRTIQKQKFYDLRDKIHSTWIRESSRENDRVTRFLQRLAGYRWMVWRCKNGSATIFHLFDSRPRNILPLSRVFPSLFPSNAYTAAVCTDGLTHGRHDKSIFFRAVTVTLRNQIRQRFARALMGIDLTGETSPSQPPLTLSLSLSLFRLEAGRGITRWISRWMFAILSHYD